MGKANEARPVTIRGVTYPSAAAAARALGVTPSAVRMARRAGTLDRCGLGRGRRAPMPVRIRGVTYTDVRAAARALGVAPGTVYSAIAEGDPDRVGRVRVPPNARPVTIAGRRFASLAEASRALGCGRRYLSNLRHAGSAAQERFYARAVALAGRDGEGAR